MLRRSGREHLVQAGRKPACSERGTIHARRKEFTMPYLKARKTLGIGMAAAKEAGK